MRDDLVLGFRSITLHKPYALYALVVRASILKGLTDHYKISHCPVEIQNLFYALLYCLKWANCQEADGGFLHCVWLNIPAGSTHFRDATCAPHAALFVFGIAPKYVTALPGCLHILAAYTAFAVSGKTLFAQRPIDECTEVWHKYNFLTGSLIITRDDSIAKHTCNFPAVVEFTTAGEIDAYVSYYAASTYVPPHMAVPPTTPDSPNTEPEGWAIVRSALARLAAANVLTCKPVRQYLQMVNTVYGSAVTCENFVADYEKLADPGPLQALCIVYQLLKWVPAKGSLGYNFYHAYNYPITAKALGIATAPSSFVAEPLFAPGAETVKRDGAAKAKRSVKWPHLNQYYTDLPLEYDRAMAEKLINVLKFSLLDNIENTSSLMQYLITHFDDDCALPVHTPGITAAFRAAGIGRPPARARAPDADPPADHDDLAAAAFNSNTAASNAFNSNASNASNANANTTNASNTAASNAAVTAKQRAADWDAGDVVVDAAAATVAGADGLGANTAGGGGDAAVDAAADVVVDKPRRAAALPTRRRRRREAPPPPDWGAVIRLSYASWCAERDLHLKSLNINRLPQVELIFSAACMSVCPGAHERRIFLNLSGPGTGKSYNANLLEVMFSDLGLFKARSRQTLTSFHYESANGARDAHVGGVISLDDTTFTASTHTDDSEFSSTMKTIYDSGVYVLNRVVQNAKNSMHARVELVTPCNVSMVFLCNSIAPFSASVVDRALVVYSSTRDGPAVVLGDDGSRDARLNRAYAAKQTQRAFVLAHFASAFQERRHNDVKNLIVAALARYSARALRCRVDTTRKINVILDMAKCDATLHAHHYLFDIRPKVAAHAGAHGSGAHAHGSGAHAHAHGSGAHGGAHAGAHGGGANAGAHGGGKPDVDQMASDADAFADAVLPCHVPNAIYQYLAEETVQFDALRHVLLNALEAKAVEFDANNIIVPVGEAALNTCSTNDRKNTINVMFKGSRLIALGNSKITIRKHVFWRLVATFIPDAWRELVDSLSATMKEAPFTYACYGLSERAQSIAGLMFTVQNLNQEKFLPEVDVTNADPFNILNTRESARILAALHTAADWPKWVFQPHGTPDRRTHPHNSKYILSWQSLLNADFWPVWLEVRATAAYNGDGTWHVPNWGPVYNYFKADDYVFPRVHKVCTFHKLFHCTPEPYLNVATSGVAHILRIMFPPAAAAADAAPPRAPQAQAQAQQQQQTGDVRPLAVPVRVVRARDVEYCETNLYYNVPRNRLGRAKYMTDYVPSVFYNRLGTKQAAENDDVRIECAQIVNRLREMTRSVAREVCCADDLTVTTY